MENGVSSVQKWAKRETDSWRKDGPSKRQRIPWKLLRIRKIRVYFLKKYHNKIHYTVRHTPSARKSRVTFKSDYKRQKERTKLLLRTTVFSLDVQTFQDRFVREGSWYSGSINRIDYLFMTSWWPKNNSGTSTINKFLSIIIYYGT